MQEAFESLLERPNKTRYLAARRLAVLHARDDAEFELARAAQAFREGRLAEARRGVENLLVPLCLSPRLHFLAAQIAEEWEDEPDAQLERFCFRSCLDGVLSTGDGSPQSPYQVTYRSDVADVLQALQMRAVRQRMTSFAGAVCDVIDCEIVENGEILENGGATVPDSHRQIWFDITCVTGRAPISMPQPHSVSGGFWQNGQESTAGKAHSAN